jgi:hypothetical protein
MSKTVEARVSVSSDTRTAHIGRYFVDVRDTTGGADRQMTTRVTDDPAAFIAELTTAGLAAGVLVELVDNTGE